MDIQLLSEYLDYLEVEKGLSVNTLEAYRRNSFILNLRENNFNPRSVVRKIASIRGFFKWLSANEYIISNPAQTIEQPKLPKRLPKVMTVDEISAILNSGLTKLEQLVVELLYGCGLRVSELVNLKMNNIDVNSKYIQCYGKGSKERIVPFGKKAQNALKHYLKDRDIAIRVRKFTNIFLHIP